MQKIFTSNARYRVALLLATGTILSGSVVLQGCGGGSSNITTPNPTPNATPNSTPGPTPNVTPIPGTGTVRGRVFAPDGRTPIANAEISSVVAAATLRTTSGADGNFTLGNLPSGTRTIKIATGQFSKTFQINVPRNGVVNAPATSTTLPTTGTGAPKIAVITGAYDKIEDVLAKVGLGTVTSGGTLRFGTEKFDLYDGDGSLPSSYPEIGTLLNNPARLSAYDIVFINCGAEELVTGAPIANLRNYINGGGRLYATDLAYDYVEQTFPAGINFLGSANTAASQKEDLDAAELGEDGITVNATIPDTGLRSFLSSRSALNANGTARIEGFLSGWAVIDSVPATTKVFAQGNVTFYEPFDLTAKKIQNKSRHSHTSHSQNRSVLRSAKSVVKPLTVVFPAGGGKILYSSYHTDETPRPTLSPQEQILFYLVFKL